MVRLCIAIRTPRSIILVAFAGWAVIGTAQNFVLDAYTTVGTQDGYSTRCMAKGPDGGLYTAGTFSGTLITGDDTLTSSHAYAVYLARFNNELELEWIQMIAENRITAFVYSPRATLETDDAGNVVVGLSYTDELYFFGDSAGGDGGKAIQVLKLGPTGSLIWSRQVMGEALGSCGVAINELGEIFLTGRGGGDVFLTKYNAGGDLIWRRVAGGLGPSDLGDNVKLDAASNVYVTGLLSPSNNVYFDSLSVSLPLTTYLASFVAKYDANGIIQWVRYVYSTTWAQFSGFRGLVIDPDGNVILAGQYADALLWFSNGYSSIGPQPVGSPRSFLTAFDANGTRLWVGVSPYASNVTDRSVDVDLFGSSILVLNEFTGVVASGSGTLDNYGYEDLRVQAFDLSGAWISDLQIGGMITDYGLDIMVQDDKVFVLGATGSHPFMVGSDSFEPPDPANTFVIRLAEGPSVIAAAAPAAGVSVFPNPSSGTFSVYGLPAREAFTLTDAQGRSVHTGLADASGNALVDLPSAAKGIYFLHYRSGGVRLCSKVVLGAP